MITALKSASLWLGQETIWRPTTLLTVISGSGNEVSDGRTLELVIQDELGLWFPAGTAIEWAIKNGYFISRELCELHGVTAGTDVHPGNTLSTVTKSTTGKVEAVPVIQAVAPKPWEIVDPNDPAPEQPWYTPARHFARQLIRDDTTLLTKRNILADKVVQSLSNAGVKKRGNRKNFGSETILKAFANVVLS